MYMSLRQTESRFDVESYLAWEEAQAERHEYLAGEVFVMSGGSDTHYTITLNFAANLTRMFHKLSKSPTSSRARLFLSNPRRARRVHGERLARVYRITPRGTPWFLWRRRALPSDRSQIS
jgi:Uma2 family endonuclease